MQAGDLFAIDTPGGGGFGPPMSEGTDVPLRMPVLFRHWRAWFAEPDASGWRSTIS